jgi:hypothetical protein
MRSPIPFDTHAYVKDLVAAGVPERQAEVHARVLADSVFTQLATKQDLADLEARIEARLKELEGRIDVRLKDLELRLTLRLGGMLVAAVAAAAALAKLL